MLWAWTPQDTSGLCKLAMVRGPGNLASSPPSHQPPMAPPSSPQPVPSRTDSCFPSETRPWQCSPDRGQTTPTPRSSHYPRGQITHTPRCSTSSPTSPKPKHISEISQWQGRSSLVSDLTATQPSPPSICNVPFCRNGALLLHGMAFPEDTSSRRGLPLHLHLSAQFS